MALRNVPSTETSSVESIPPPPGASGMANRVTRVLVLFLVVNSTLLPVEVSLTALRQDASPARSPTVRFGPTTVAPPARTPSSASYMSFGMLAPRPAKNGLVLVLLACLTASSLPSFASTTLTVYLPFTAVHEPRFTGGAVAPAAMAPLTEPGSVFTTEPFASRSESVMPWEPDAEAMVPWFLTATPNDTLVPLEGLPGLQVTDEATRSELETGATTSDDGFVYALLPSFSSRTASASSTLPTSWYVPASRAPAEAVTVQEAPAARAPTEGV